MIHLSSGRTKGGTLLSATRYPCCSIIPFNQKELALGLIQARPGLLWQHFCQLLGSLLQSFMEVSSDLFQGLRKWPFCLKSVFPTLLGFVRRIWGTRLAYRVGACRRDLRKLGNWDKTSVDQEQCFQTCCPDPEAPCLRSLRVL